MEEKLTLDQFERLVGDVFVACFDDQEFELELTEAVSLLKAGETRPEELRAGPFSLLFRGPLEPVIDQQLVPLRHSSFEDLTLFIVPLGPGDGAMQYEAIFN